MAVDSVEVAKIESGDILIPLRETGGSFPGIELSGIVAGKRPGRTSIAQITVFKSNGLAVEDIAVAGYVYQEALKRGLGQNH